MHVIISLMTNFRKLDSGKGRRLPEVVFGGKVRPSTDQTSKWMGNITGKKEPFSPGTYLADSAITPRFS